MRYVFLFLRREVILTLVMVVSLVPALCLAGMADIACRELHALSIRSALNGQLPGLSQVFVALFERLDLFPAGAVIAIWLASAIWYLATAFTAPSSSEFRLRFVPGLLLLWFLILAIVSVVLLASVLPHASLHAAITANPPSKLIPILILSELLLLLIIPAIHIIRMKRRSA